MLADAVCPWAARVLPRQLVRLRPRARFPDQSCREAIAQRAGHETCGGWRRSGSKKSDVVNRRRRSEATIGRLRRRIASAVGCLRGRYDLPQRRTIDTRELGILDGRGGERERTRVAGLRSASAGAWRVFGCLRVAAGRALRFEWAYAWRAWGAGRYGAPRRCCFQWRRRQRRLRPKGVVRVVEARGGRALAARGESWVC